MDLNIETKEIEYCRFEVDVVAPKDVVQRKKKDVLEQFKNAPCPGFRKGKATKEAIQLHYKLQIEESLKRALAEETFHEVLFQKEWKNLGSPNFKTMLIQNDKYFCKFVLDTIPSFELQNVRGIEIPKPTEKQSLESIANEKMEEIKYRFGETKFFSEGDFIENGDSVIIAYKAKDEDGNVIEQLCSESEVVVVGTKTDRDFSDNLLGMKIGEEREFDYAIKSNAQSALANKNVKFTVKCSNGTKTVPHEVNNDLASKMNKESVLDLQEHVNVIAKGIFDQRVKQEVQQLVSQSLVEAHQFKVQDWLVEKESIMLCNSSKINYQTLTEEDKKIWQNIARKNVKLSLILEKVRENEPEAQLTDQEVIEELKRALKNELKDNSTESLVNYLSKMGNYAQVLFARVRDEFALNFVVKYCKVIN